MPENRPDIRTLGVAETRRQFSRILDEVFHGGGRVIVEKHGIPVAAIVPPGEVHRQPSTFDHEDLYQALSELDNALRSLPRDERRTAVEQALARVQTNGERDESPAAFFDDMLARDDIRSLLIRLAGR